MARTINEIKESMLNAYAKDDVIREKYDMEDGKELEFSKVSIENILFYVIAAMLWTVEVLFDRHKQEVTDYIEQMKPHGLRWYVSKAKMFRYGEGLMDEAEYQLINGTDRYPDIKDNKKLTEAQIEEMQIVKFAAANELVNTNEFYSNDDKITTSAISNSDGVVYLKIAKGNNTEKSRLSDDEFAAFITYINEVKDAGVMVEVINEPANLLRLKLDIYVNPMIISANTGKLVDPNRAGELVVENAIKHYISNLPFNGEYRNVDLIDALQKVEGVVIPELKKAEESFGGAHFNEINAKSTPSSGHYVFVPVNPNDPHDESASKINYIPYSQKPTINK